MWIHGNLTKNTFSVRTRVALQIRTHDLNKNIDLIIYILQGNSKENRQADFNSQSASRGLQRASICIGGQAKRRIRSLAQSLIYKRLSCEAKLRFGPSHTQEIRMSLERRRHKEEQAGDRGEEQSEVVLS